MHGKPFPKELTVVVLLTRALALIPYEMRAMVVGRPMVRLLLQSGIWCLTHGWERV